MRKIESPQADVFVYPDGPALSQAGAEEFQRAAADAIKRRQRFLVALAGGSTPRGVYASLAETARSDRASVPWDKVHFFFGDERAVPPDHPESNYRMAWESLLSRIPVSPDQIHRVRAELDPTEAAAAYGEEIRAVAGISNANEPPRFDLILLGLGTDGHTASLFPNTKALEENRAWATANWVEKLQAYRLTLTFPVLNAAREVAFIVGGSEKAMIVSHMLRGNSSAEVYPAQRVRPRDGRLLWLLDEAAAEGL